MMTWLFLCVVASLFLAGVSMILMNCIMEGVGTLTYTTINRFWKNWRSWVSLYVILSVLWLLISITSRFVWNWIF